MTSGRYDPPRAVVETPQADARAPSDRPKRPLAVTAFQVLLVLICAASLLRSLRFGLWILTHGDDRRLGDGVLQLASAATYLVATAVAIIVIHQARPWARYLGWLIFAVLIGFTQIDASEGVPPQYAQTPAMQGGYQATAILWEFLLVVWALRFGLSAKARRYFGARIPPTR